MCCMSCSFILAHTLFLRAGVHLFPHPPSDFISHEVAKKGIVLRILALCMYNLSPVHFESQKVV
jgi:hypothetical protein